MTVVAMILLCLIELYATSASTTETPMTSSVTSGMESVNLLGAGASFPATVYYEWMALYSYSRQRQPTDSLIVKPTYTSFDSYQGKYVMCDMANIYQYGATDILLDHLDQSMNPTLATMPIVAG